METPASRRDLLFQFRGTPPIGASISLALQHLVAMIVGCVTPPIIIAGAIGLSQADRVLLIQASLVMSAVCTLLQLFPIGGRFGSGLPVILGVSFAYLPSMQAIVAGGGGVSAIAGAMLVGGVVAVLVGIFVKKIRMLFPPVITGTVVFTIGLSLYPTAINYMAGGTANTAEAVAAKGLPEAMVYGSWQNWLIAALTLTVVMLLNNKAKGVCKLASILLGMLFGYVVALCFGMVSFADVGNAAWFSLPRFMHFGISFDVPSCVAMGLLFAINSIQAIGDFAGGFLLLAGVSPKFAAILTTIPQCVLGGATITVFSTIAMTGMKLIASQDLTARNTTIVGLSAALGVGISQASAALSQFPAAVTMIFGKSPVVIATLMAVLLNLILPKDKK